ncbi:hypothetical protein CTZ27_31845 [Streptomyces griseocarneus]|nr:hypothetical protein CTZ27_31845 [Streptomyces griseocarneus]
MSSPPSGRSPSARVSSPRCARRRCSPPPRCPRSTGAPPRNCSPSRWRSSWKSRTGAPRSPSRGAACTSPPPGRDHDPKGRSPMTEVLNVVTRAITGIRPDLGGPGTAITRDSALFYAADPEQPVLGLDSMEALELITALERELGIELADTDVRIADLHTVGDVIDAMSAAR